MKTLEVEIELMKYFGVRRKIIVPNVYWGMSELYYECDLIVLTNSGYATEVEIKVSKGDLLKDKEKKHNHDSKLFKYFYFAVPEKLEDIALTEIPEKAGLLVVKTKQVKIGFDFSEEIKFVEEVKKPLINKTARKWSNEKRCKLLRLGTMRILGLKKKIFKLKYS